MACYRLFVLAVCILVGACQTTRPIPQSMKTDHRKYLTLPHYKAMYGVIGMQGNWTYGWAWGEESVAVAVSKAEDQCEKGASDFDIEAMCILHFVGDTETRNMTKEEYQVVIATYENDTTVSINTADTPVLRVKNLGWRRAFNGWKLKEHSSAFALNKSGYYGWVVDRPDVKTAVKGAMKFCQKYGFDCRIVAIDGEILDDFYDLPVE